MHRRFDRSRANAVNPNLIPGGGPALWLDGSDASTITQTNGLISAWADKSGNGYTFAQATDANKPYLTRSDSLENRLLQSENLATTWTPSQVTVVNATDLYEIAGTSEKYVTQTAEVVKGTSYTYTASAKAINGRHGIALRIRGSGFKLAYFNLQDGTAGTVTAGATSSIEPDTALGTGWYKCSITWAVDASASAAQVIYIAGADNDTNVAGDITKGVQLTKMHFARTGKGYVTTTTYPQYAGLNGRAVPYFPGAATYMSRAFTAALDIGVGDNTIFAVVQLDNNGADAGTNFSILDNETFQTKGGMLRFSGGASGGLPRFRTSQAGADTYVQSTTVVSGLSLVAATKSGTTGQLYRNGAIDGASATVNNAVTSSANALNLGNLAGATTGLCGYLPEVIVFNRALSSSERMWIENYLRVKWGI